MGLMLFFSLGGFGLIFLLPFPIGYKLVLWVLVIAYGVYLLRRSIMGLSYYERQWCLHTHRGDIFAELSRESTVTTWVCVLRFVIPGRFFKKTCVIFQDAIPRNVYRQLLVHIRHSSKQN